MVRHSYIAAVATFLVIFGAIVCPISASAKAPACLLPLTGWKFEESAESRKIEDDTIAMLENLIVRNSKVDVPKQVDEWMVKRLQKQNSGLSLSVGEHVALIFLKKIEFFEKVVKNPETAAQRDQMLKRSFEDLTGGEAPEDLISPLPLSVRMRMTREERVFHAAVFVELNPRNRPKVGRAAVAARFGIAALIPVALHTLGLETTSMLASGYMIASIAERMIHKHLGHASPRLKAWAEKAGPFGRFILDMTYSHTDIHHNKTYVDSYIEQFTSREEQDKLDEELHLLEELGEKIIKDRYGVTISTISYIKGMFVAMPVHATLIFALGLSPVSIAALVAPALLYGAASKFMHPMMHESREKVLADATPFQRWFYNTWYAEMISRLHFGHHRGGITGNYNLVFGADWLFGELFKPSMKQYLQMRKLGLIGASWEEQRTAAASSP